MTIHTPILAFDVGGSKTAWGLFGKNGTLHAHGKFPTPSNRDPFLRALLSQIREYRPKTIGIGIAGTLSADHQDVVVCTNLPNVSHFELIEALQEGAPIADDAKLPIALDNDARCALIGEVWQGCAQDRSSAVMLTLGTGVGGAVMQKGKVLPHPRDLADEIGRLVVDPSDLFPAPCGNGTVEALLGGRNLEERFGLTMAELAQRVRIGDAEVEEVWRTIAEHFRLSVRTIYELYRPSCIIIGGKGVNDLEYYTAGAEFPCPILPAALGELAGLYGAARLALDVHEEIEEWE